MVGTDWHECMTGPWPPTSNRRPFAVSSPFLYFVIMEVASAPTKKEYQRMIGSVIFHAVLASDSDGTPLLPFWTSSDFTNHLFSEIINKSGTQHPWRYASCSQFTLPSILFTVHTSLFQAVGMSIYTLTRPLNLLLFLNFFSCYFFFLLIRLELGDLSLQARTSIF